MKPSVPETGIVIAIDDGMAKVMLQGGEACRGCGQAKIGLCKSAGLSMIIKARNTLNANIGDRVIVGIDEGIRIRGYLLAFVIPLLSLVAGTILGLLTVEPLHIRGLEVISGFSGLIAGSFFSLKRLKRLDKESNLIVKSIISEY